MSPSRPRVSAAKPIYAQKCFIRLGEIAVTVQSASYGEVGDGSLWCGRKSTGSQTEGSLAWCGVRAERVMRRRHARTS